MKITSFGILASVLFLFSPLRAQLAYTSGHADIGIGFEDDELAPHWHFHAGAVVGGVELPDEAEYEPGEVAAIVADSQKVARPAGAEWNFLGIPAGADLWYLPQVQESGVPFLGIGAEELNGADWEGDLTITLLGLTGPGDFALWASGVFGEPDVFMQTADGISGADVVLIEAGGHRHFNWGFTAPGVYELQLQFQGTHETLGLLTENATFAFVVAPEPSVFLLLGAGGAALIFARRRRSRRAGFSGGSTSGLTPNKWDMPEDVPPFDRA